MSVCDFFADNSKQNSRSNINVCDFAGNRVKCSSFLCILRDLKVGKSVQYTVQ